MEPCDAVLTLHQVGKKYPGVQALAGLDLVARRGEVHALIGENGAGKSTAIKIMTGVQAPDEGHLLLHGRPVRLKNPHDARLQGVNVVPQDILAIPELSVGRNILLGLEGGLSRRTGLSTGERARVTAALDLVGAHIDPDVKAGDLGIPELRLMQLARGIVSERRDVLVLDEPTAVLAEADVEHLVRRVQALRDDGTAVIYVSHRLGEVMTLADRITVLRDGRAVGHFARGETEAAELIALMTKEAAARPAPQRRRNAPAVRDADAPLEVCGLSLPGRFEDVALRAGRGQVIAIAGVQGSGHGHLLRAIAGADTPSRGTVTVAGRRVDPRSIRGPFGHGVLLVPADRRGAAIFPGMSVHANMAVSHRIRSDCRRLGLRWKRRERAMTREYVDRFTIRPRTMDATAAHLSGGNQQKLAIARALESKPHVLLIEEPTQGVDIHARAEIHELLASTARLQDRCVVVATSDFEEAIGLADVVHVMRCGRLVATFDGASATYRDILAEALP